jgi:hypothetical protein
MNPDEHVADISENLDYGYQVVTIGGEGISVGDSVLLVMPKEDCSVEAQTLIGNKVLTITPKAGHGKTIVNRAGTDKLETFYETDGVVRLLPGDTYGYKNCGTEPFIVRDDCAPTFVTDDEVSLLNNRAKKVSTKFLKEYESN